MISMSSASPLIQGTGRFSKTEKVDRGAELKLQRIINKFKSGKRLTSGELSYLATNAPETHQKVLRIMAKRDQLEKRLELADTKEEVQQIMMQEMQSVEKFSTNNEDDFETTALVNQLMDAYGETLKSDSYRAKPDNSYEVWEEMQGADAGTNINLSSNEPKETTAEDGEKNAWELMSGMPGEHEAGGKTVSDEGIYRKEEGGEKTFLSEQHPGNPGKTTGTGRTTPVSYRTSGRTSGTQESSAGSAKKKGRNVDVML